MEEKNWALLGKFGIKIKWGNTVSLNITCPEVQIFSVEGSRLTFSRGSIPQENKRSRFSTELIFMVRTKERKNWQQKTLGDHIEVKQQLIGSFVMHDSCWQPVYKIWRKESNQYFLGKEASIRSVNRISLIHLCFLLVKPFCSGV